MTVAKDNFCCSNNFLLLQLNSDGIDDDNIQSLGHGQCVVEQRELFTLCKIPPLRRNFAWGAKYPIMSHDSHTLHVMMWHKLFQWPHMCDLKFWYVINI